MRDGGGVRIQEGSLEWKQVVCKLQVVTGQPALRLLQLRHFPQSNSPAEQLIPAIIDATGLKTQFVELVLAKTIPLEDMIVVCGHINLLHYHKKLDKVFHFLICHISCGTTAPFLAGFTHADSLVIQNQYGQPFHHNIFLKSHKQYEVVYECSFVVEDPGAVRVSEIRCCRCGNRKASVYCRTEQKHYCEGCSQNVHAPPPLETRKKMKELPLVHQLQPITRSNSLPLCDSHNQRHQFFCLQCEKYLCEFCSRQPFHADNPDHQFRPIEYLYTEKRQIYEKIPARPRQNLSKLKKILKKKQNQIRVNYENVRQEINKEFNRALNQLQNLYREKIGAVESDLIQVRMELEKLDWQYNYLKKQEEQLKPIHYFTLQKRLVKQMETIGSSRFGTSLDQKGNLDCCCFAEVGFQDQINALKMSEKTVRQMFQGKVKAKNTQKRSQVSQQIQDFMDYCPQKDIRQIGRLSFDLEHSGIKFFKFRPIQK